MGEIRRAADGRPPFGAAFKCAQIPRVVRGAMTLAGLSRELDVSPSVVRVKNGGMDARTGRVRAGEEPVNSHAEG